ncbi:MAG: FkbM family methyltransferase [Alphaproteobacteria bacterium]|nr:FkbM family methyltransferase [Alphaproteobacteria bacterium]
MTIMTTEALAQHQRWLQTARNPAWEPFSLVERVLRGIYETILVPGDQVIDGGANRGMHTLPLAEKVGAGGRVVAVEANPSLAAAMTIFVAQHGLDNITVVNKALGVSDGTTSFNRAPHVDALSGIRRRPDLANQVVEVIDVPMTTLDSLIAKHELDRLRFVKLDLEGGEYDTLRGSPGFLHMTSAPLMILENGRQYSGDLYDYGKEAWFKLFAETGYEQFDLFGNPFTPDVWGEPDLIWYSIAAKRAEDIDFVTQQLVPLIQTIHDALPPGGEQRWPTQRFPHAYIT